MTFPSECLGKPGNRRRHRGEMEDGGGEGVGRGDRFEEED